MSAFRVPPAWQLPEGVNAPLWQYTHTPRLAAEEDAYFADHPLFRADARALDERFATPGRLVDLGCGAGRHAIRFAAPGFPVAAVDLSRPMLEIVGQKAARPGSTLLRVEANLCRLGCFPDATFDYALSMFSTLGMIRGRDARRRALAEVSPDPPARAAGWRSTPITSGSTSATARAAPGCSGTPSGPSSAATSSASAG